MNGVAQIDCCTNRINAIGIPQIHNLVINRTKIREPGFQSTGIAIDWPNTLQSQIVNGVHQALGALCLIA